MIVEFKKIVKSDELIHLIPVKQGATFSQMWQIFYYTRLFKYIAYDQYSQIKKSFNKICTYRKLEELCTLGYLKSPTHKVYCATNKVLPILREAGYNIDILPAEPVGKGDSNELHNTHVFIQVSKLEHFYTLLYPQFKVTKDVKPFLIPDALAVQIDKNNKKFKLTFLEVEAKKPKWEQYLHNKREKYLQLSRESIFVDYWRTVSVNLGLNHVPLEQLKFNVAFICESIHLDFGKGFKFYSENTRLF